MIGGGPMREAVGRDEAVGLVYFMKRKPKEPEGS
jgi:hypothetical protein